MVQSVQGSFTESKHNLKQVGVTEKNARIMKAIAAPCKYVETNQYTMENALTGQNNWSSTYFGDQITLRKVGAEALKVLGQPQVGSIYADAPGRFLLESIHATYTFINRTNTPSILKVYFVRPKFDIGDSNTYVSPAGTTYTWSGPVGAIQMGVAASAGNTTSANNYVTPGIEPRDSSIFTDYFAVNDSIEVLLGAGGIHTLQVKRPYNRVCGGEHYGNTALNYYRQFSEILVFKALGTPGVINDQPTAVTTMPTKLAWTETVTYHYTAVNNSLAVMDDINSLSQDTLTNLGGMTFVDVANGAGSVAGKI